MARSPRAASLQQCLRAVAPLRLRVVQGLWIPRTAVAGLGLSSGFSFMAQQGAVLGPGQETPALGLTSRAGRSLVLHPISSATSAVAAVGVLEERRAVEESSALINRVERGQLLG